MAVILANNVNSTLGLDLNSTSGAMRVATGTGSRFPVIPAGQYFYATVIATDGRWEIVKAVARTGDTISVTRGQENTIAQAFPAGSRVELRITAASVMDAISDYNIHVGTEPPANPVINALWVDTN